MQFCACKFVCSYAASVKLNYELRICVAILQFVEMELVTLEYDSTISIYTINKN